MEIIGGAAAGAVIGAVAGGVSHALRHPGKSLGEYVRDTEFRKAVGTGAASGAVAGAVFAAIPLGLAALGLKAATAGGAAFIGWVSGSLAGAAGQITANLLTPCTKWHQGVPRAMFWGGVGGAAFGWAGWHVRQWLAGQAAKSTTQPLERHHLLPRQFRSYFERAGLDINSSDYTVELPRDVHRLKPNGLHTGPDNWNALWRRFFEANPNASSVKILEHLEWMKGRFGLR